MPHLPTGTVTFLFTDIEGSTRLLQQLGNLPATDVFAEHRRLLREAFAAGGGYEYQDQGDGFLVVFQSAHAAVETAIVAQRVIARHAWPDGTALRVRVSLHTAEAVATEGVYMGLGIHKAARICAAGWGSQVLLSQTTAQVLENDLPEGAALRALGEHRLKDMERPEAIFQLLHSDLLDEFPPLQSLDRLPTNLPLQLTSFVGREREIVEIKRLVGTSRLVTLTGPGGAGKTRLALQVGADVLDEFADGVWLIELAPLADPALVPQAIGSTLRVREHPGRPAVATLTDVLGAWRLLLVLDNCEHLVTACAEVADTLLRACPHIRILATSREPLGVGGEATWRVPSLELPDIEHPPAASALGQSEAVRLFVDRAAAGHAGFALNERNALPVAQICRQLDGMPLAIELAAARVEVLSPEEIAARLGDRFRLLTGGSRTAQPRQQTLRAAMDWSYTLLSDNERLLLARLSVFAGGFTLEAAEAVGAEGAISAGEVLDLLMGLVRKSLVIVQTHDGPSRYGMLETVRQYARERLEESGEAPAVRTRHLYWILPLAEQGRIEFGVSDEHVRLARLEAEHDNLRVALEWSKIGEDLVEQGLSVAGNLWAFWFIRGHMGEGRAWLKDLLERTPGVATSARALALNAAANLAIFPGNFDAAVRYAQEALTLAQALGDGENQGWALYNLGGIAAGCGQYDRAAVLYNEARALAQTVGRWFLEAVSVQGLGDRPRALGDYGSAARFYEEALSLVRPHGSTLRVHSLTPLVYVSLSQGDYRQAASHFAECVSVCREFGDEVTQAWVLLGMAGVIGRQGHAGHAARLFGAADAALERFAYLITAVDRGDVEREKQFTRQTLGDEAFEAACNEGRRLSLEQAVESALTHARSLQG